MSVEIKSIKTGVLSTTADSLIYTAPEDTAVLIKIIRLVNANATTTATINLYFKQSGQTKRAILPVGVSLPAKHLLIEDEELTMSDGDEIRGDASIANVEFVISGLEREVV